MKQLDGVNYRWINFHKRFKWDLWLELMAAITDVDNPIPEDYTSFLGRIDSTIFATSADFKIKSFASFMEDFEDLMKDQRREKLPNVYKNYFLREIHNVCADLIDFRSEMIVPTLKAKKLVSRVTYDTRKLHSILSEIDNIEKASIQIWEYPFLSKEILKEIIANQNVRIFIKFKKWKDALSSLNEESLATLMKDDSEIYDYIMESVDQNPLFDVKSNVVELSKWYGESIEHVDLSHWLFEYYTKVFLWDKRTLSIISEDLRYSIATLINGAVSPTKSYSMDHHDNDRILLSDVDDIVELVFTEEFTKYCPEDLILGILVDILDSKVVQSMIRNKWEDLFDEVVHCFHTVPWLAEKVISKTDDKNSNRAYYVYLIRDVCASYRKPVSSVIWKDCRSDMKKIQKKHTFATNSKNPKGSWENISEQQREEAEGTIWLLSNYSDGKSLSFRFWKKRDVSLHWVKWIKYDIDIKSGKNSWHLLYIMRCIYDNIERIDELSSIKQQYIYDLLVYDRDRESSYPLIHKEKYERIFSKLLPSLQPSEEVFNTYIKHIENTEYECDWIRIWEELVRCIKVINWEWVQSFCDLLNEYWSLDKISKEVINSILKNDSWFMNLFISDIVRMDNLEKNEGKNIRKEVLSIMEENWFPRERIFALQKRVLPEEYEPPLLNGMPSITIEYI